MKRSDFLKRLFGGAAAIVVGPQILNAAEKVSELPEEVDSADNDTPDPFAGPPKIREYKAPVGVSDFFGFSITNHAPFNTEPILVHLFNNDVQHKECDADLIKHLNIKYFNYHKGRFFRRFTEINNISVYSNELRKTNLNFNHYSANGQCATLHVQPALYLRNTMYACDMVEIQQRMHFNKDTQISFYIHPGQTIDFKAW